MTSTLCVKPLNVVHAGITKVDLSPFANQRLRETTEQQGRGQRLSSSTRIRVVYG